MQIRLCTVTEYAKRAIDKFSTTSIFLNPQTSLMNVKENAVSPVTVAGREAKAEPIRHHPHPLGGFAVLGVEKITHSAQL